MDFTADCLSDHECAGQVDKGAVAVGPFLPTNTKSAEIVVPAVGALDHPASGLAPHAANQRRLTPASDVRSHASLPRLVLGVGVVIAFVEAKIPGTTRTARASNRDRVERGADHPLVVDVRASQRDRDGNSASVGQNVAFCAEFSTIGRVRPGEIPPLGAFTEALSIEHHSRSSPTFSW